MVIIVGAAVKIPIWTLKRTSQLMRSLRALNSRVEVPLFKPSLVDEISQAQELQEQSLQKQFS